MTQQPKGASGPPQRRLLQGSYGRLEPLDEARHGESLWQAVKGADAMWTYMAYGPWHDETSFRAWLKERQALTDPLYYAVVDGKTNRALGCVTLMRIDQTNGCIETGHIFFSPALQKTPLATEAVFLQAKHVFDDLGYRRFEWKCDNANEPSRRAARRFGFVFEGIFRQHAINKGRNRDTAWFSIIDGEWPARKAAFERFLALENFDADGQQKVGLSALNGATG
ncbi:Protein N-acetyltransferase, RimJ/RimL family [Rhizobiales bacterium GAS188]|nr:Protein N-acetyltransferase, RimJ/RimL family [Rhizobiales bacterium GAS188]